MEVSLGPWPRSLQGPIQGYKESSAQVDLSWGIMPSFPLSQLQDPEHTKVKHKGEQAGDECWAPQGEPPEPGLGPGPKAGLRPPIWWTVI